MDFYTTQYSAAGALNAGFTIYRMFEADAKHNRAWREKNGNVIARAMIMSGERVFMIARALEMVIEMYEEVAKELARGVGTGLPKRPPRPL